MKTHIKKIIILGFFLVSIIACEKEDSGDKYNNFSDPVATASGDMTIQRGDFTSFADLSKGVTKRTWTLPETASIINLEGRDPSEMEIIHVQFDTPGEFEVNLKNEFKDSSVKLDETFNVTVFDYIQTNFEVVSIDASFYEETPTQIDMYEGGTINFKDTSLGNPNRRKWLFPGGDPSSAGGISVDDDKDFKNIAVSYPTIGTYDVSLVSWRQYPEGSKDTLHLKDYINVIENIDPPTLTQITESDAGVLHLNYNLPLKLTADLIPHLTLTVDGIKTDILSAAINVDDNRIVDITTTENIKSTSVATLSYDNSQGVLVRVNDVVADSFTDQPVNLFVPLNLANSSIYGFEDGGAGWMAASDNVGEISFTDQKAASGNYSMRMEATADGKWTRSWSWKEGSEFALKAGQKVTIEFKIWIDPSYTDGSIGPWITGTEAPYPGTQFWTGMSGLPRGEWITINKETAKVWTVTADGDYFIAFRFQKKGVIYIDDVKVFVPE